MENNFICLVLISRAKCIEFKDMERNIDIDMHARIHIYTHN